jgi:hypothetical protein
MSTKPLALLLRGSVGSYECMLLTAHISPIISPFFGNFTFQCYALPKKYNHGFFIKEKISIY